MDISILYTIPARLPYRNRSEPESAVHSTTWCRRPTGKVARYALRARFLPRRMLSGRSFDVFSCVVRGESGTTQSIEMIDSPRKSLHPVRCVPLHSDTETTGSSSPLQAQHRTGTWSSRRRSGLRVKLLPLPDRTGWWHCGSVCYLCLRQRRPRRGPRRCPVSGRTTARHSRTGSSYCRPAKPSIPTGPS
jgi:hypothetical protein